MATTTEMFAAIPLPKTLPSQRLAQKDGVVVPSDIYQAVADASSKVGVSFSYLMTKASTESDFDANAKSGNSSASGLYQFVSNTWLDMVDKYGSKYGLGQYADAITRNADGTPSVNSASTRRAILNLRKDPELSAFMAAEYANENKQTLEKNLGRKVNDTELYLAHFLGAGGATRFLKAMDRNPNTSAAQVLPQAAEANSGVFYSRSSGKALTLAQVYNRFDDKFDSAPTYYADNTGNSPVMDASVSTETQPRVAQYGAIPGSDQPFMSNIMLSALEGSVETDRQIMPAQASRNYAATQQAAFTTSLYDNFG